MDNSLLWKELSPSNSLKSPRDYFLENIRDGLVNAESFHRHISCSFFYDQKGSQLFEQITEVEEYYPTKAESEILEDHSKEFVQLLSFSNTTKGNMIKTSTFPSIQFFIITFHTRF